MAFLRSPRLKRFAISLLFIACAGVIVLLSVRYDFPAMADAPPYHLQKLGFKEGDQEKVYVHFIGGYIDTVHAWRIDGPPEMMQKVIEHLALKPSDTVPNEFWKVPPYYWPRSLQPGMIAYRSSQFVDDERGPDGPHFFLLHDTNKNRAYVLFKENF